MHAVGDAMALQARLLHAVEQARAAWPKITLDAEIFVAHLARHARSSSDPSAFVDTVHASDLYLACGVCHHDRAALAYFEEHFVARIPEYAMRVRASRDVVEEVQQKLREHLIVGSVAAEAGAARTPKIAEYSGKGALGGWLRVTAVRTTLNHLRAAGPATEGLGEELALGNDPELAYVHAHAHVLFADAFKRVLAGLEPAERTILRLHYIDGLTMDQLAHLYKIPRSTIARRVAAARQQIMQATESLLRDERRLSASSVASIIRQAQSRLQVTFTTLFK